MNEIEQLTLTARVRKDVAWTARVVIRAGATRRVSEMSASEIRAWLSDAEGPKLDWSGIRELSAILRAAAMLPGVTA